jgi:glycosyltransferase involved in cell wall biosynthesis
MATFNRAHLIEETLESISNQIYKNWECIIIDDGSNDHTNRVVNKWVNKDQRYNYYKRNNQHKKGLPGCRNQGLEIAKGDYIIFFDDDDIVHPQNLELCERHLKNELYDFCRYNRSVFVGDFKYNFSFSFDYESFIIKSEDVYKLLTHQIPFNSCAVMWNKRCFNNDFFNENLMYAEEWELYSRILMKPRTQGISIGKTLFFGRKHSKSNTGEYYKGNQLRVKSKIEATVEVLNNLDKLCLLDLRYIKFFLGIRKKSESKPIYKALLKAKSLKLKEKLYVRFRYTFLPLLKFLYLLKKLKN